MALLTRDAVEQSLNNLFVNSSETNENIAELERDVDVYEDRLGSYLVRIAGKNCRKVIVELCQKYYIQ